MSNYVVGHYYQHRYGGVYQVLNRATHTETGESLIIYEHVYPFDRGVWARPESMWTPDRFRHVGTEELQQLLRKNQLQFQQEINAAKAAK